MGDRAGGGQREPADTQPEDVARIVEAVREVVGARAVMISRVVDDDWLEVVAFAGANGMDPSGRRWRRSDLTRSLETSRRVGRLHLTTRRAVAAGGEGMPDSGILIAPLNATDRGLVGVLATDGPADVGRLAPETCTLLELYADQARLALDLQREHATLAEHLRLSEAAQAVLHEATEQPDVPAMLASIVATTTEMMAARGVWACAALTADTHAAASQPPEVGGRLGADTCDLVLPVVTACWRDDVTLTEESSPVLSGLAAQAGLQRALVAAIGSPRELRGALLVLRSPDDPPWTERERESLRGLGRRLGTVVEQLETRRRDQDVVDQLRELVEYRRDLVASITHDLKTPLTAIRLNTELLAADRRLAEAGAHPVAAIRRSADRLSRLVDDLLALARTEEGAAGPPGDADVVALVREACRHAEVEAQPRGVTFVLDLPDELRAPVDAEALARVYVNVVDNAVKFSLPGGEVRISVRRAKGAVELVCSDDGIGISEEDQAAVFDVFRRSRDPRASVVPGSGIGLAISQRIVARLGGSIGVESVQGEGSTFVVSVPAEPRSA